MKKIYLLFVMLTLALGVFAQSKGKNAMTLRLVDIKVTDGTLVNIAKEQEAKGNTKPMDMIRIYEGNVRAKLDEVAKASGRFEISDENALEALTRDAEASLFMKMSRAEKIEYVSSKQNDYIFSFVFILIVFWLIVGVYWVNIIKLVYIRNIKMRLSL